MGLGCILKKSGLPVHRLTVYLVIGIPGSGGVYIGNRAVFSYDCWKVNAGEI